ncbi:MAG TPA: sigma-70 family RNA polymerase sigma factor [Candidatus Polarisedimenticolaceae bacterium]|nr:sigma-70 family RNA polymerase sigma factor [Candidatus Polarisedimenticolaceae bacterium]
MDVATLLERCRRGDDLAWEALVRGYQASVYAVTRHYLRDPEEARDVAQDVFVRLYERLDSFGGGDTFKSWLVRMARNACIDRLRRIKARPPARGVPVEDSQLVAADDPQRSAEGQEREQLLRRAVATLSADKREVLLLKEIQGLKLEEVAQLLGVPLGTVKSRCNRARIELADTLRKLDPSFG